MQKERSDFLKWGHEDFLRDQLLVRDNFERAVDHARSIGFEKATPFGQVVLGVEMILQQFSDSLKNQGVQEIQTVGKKFDPLQHEAVMQEDSETAEQDTVLRDLQKGYVLHGRLLRAARVVTACAKKTV
jgi:molecular chaperone GrpE